jgi:signal transduction histidine kinase
LTGREACSLASHVVSPQLERSLRRFIAFDQVTCWTAVAAILGAHIGIHRNSYLVLLAAMVGGAGALMGAARRRAAAGNLRAAVVWMAVANWGVSLGATAVAPFCLPITVVAAMLPSILAVPYVGVRDLWAISTGSMVVALMVTAVGSLQDFSGLADQLPPWLPPLVILLFVPFIAGLVVMVSAHNSAGLRHALNDALEANRRLRVSEGELRESRARLVAATDQERRRIARDLHDGAQQRLIAVALGLNRARRDHAPACPAGDGVLAAFGLEIQESITELRRLASGLCPPVLSDRGLREALAEMIARAPHRCRMEAAPLPRFTPEVEAAVYWCCVEAVQNFGKHGGADARLVLRIAGDGDGGLMFDVEDDGVGFDPAQARRGQGLTNMADRIGAAGGQIDVWSSPGRGVRVHGVIPADTASGTRSSSCRHPGSGGPTSEMDSGHDYAGSLPAVRAAVVVPAP